MAKEIPIKTLEYCEYKEEQVEIENNFLVFQGNWLR